VIRAFVIEFSHQVGAVTEREAVWNSSAAVAKPNHACIALLMRDVVLVHQFDVLRARQASIARRKTVSTQIGLVECSGYNLADEGKGLFWRE
jgi:hypothetical protein